LAGWYGWLGCEKYKKLGPYLSKSPGTRFAFPSAPPSKADGARGRVRTALKSTVSSAYGSNDDWHTLGSQADQIYGWEAPYTTLVYTTHIHSTCIKVGRDAPHRRKRVRENRGSLGLPCSLCCPLIDHPVCVDRESDPAPFQSFWAAPGTQQRSQSSRLQLRPTYAAALVDRTFLSAAKAASCRNFGLGLGGGDDWRRLRGLRGVGCVVCRRYRSVEVQSEALSVGVRERVCGGDVSGQQAVGRCAQGGTAFK
jgi:hypothetical protein